MAPGGRLKADDRSWFEPLVRITARPATRFAYVQVRNIDLAQELVQEAFARVWASPKTPSQESEFRRWLYRTITNLVTDYYRQQSRWPKGVIRIAGTVDPLEEVERRAGDAEMLGALDRLSVRERQALYLRYFEDLSFAESARILRMPQVTVRVIVHRALGKLRDRLTAGRAGQEVAV
jgi:RNA polymerase sigma-70 factor (ECF subfamily)